MPADLLRYVGGPTPYSVWWLVIALALLAAVIVWYTAVFVLTMPSYRLRRIPVIRGMHARLLRMLFARTVHTIDLRHRAGELSAAQASAQTSRALRSFLHQATGTRAQYMHVGALAESDVAAAVPLLSDLNDAQFNPCSRIDVSRTAAATEELIRTWS